MCLCRAGRRGGRYEAPAVSAAARYPASRPAIDCRPPRSDP
ncbi:MAG: hypothetical protein AVDCRST_MAG59-3193 [uncultured Thermomicrobiales bacterium]|uniref:Uncharacterized protein n=1 Tax=uncultured Thermomicrobiales bacterium TaxID=1645740 RepID=A0A6J4V6B8_9BACT|nr:MAG: hypothetical protein AVDCRST_MAG59-3193 [uncultured Thermomicrobiales bacterium]